MKTKSQGTRHRNGGLCQHQEFSNCVLSCQHQFHHSATDCILEVPVPGMVKEDDNIKWPWQTEDVVKHWKLLEALDWTDQEKISERCNTSLECKVKEDYFSNSSNDILVLFEVYIACINVWTFET